LRFFALSADPDSGALLGLLVRAAARRDGAGGEDKYLIDFEWYFAVAVEGLWSQRLLDESLLVASFADVSRDESQKRFCVYPEQQLYHSSARSRLLGIPTTVKFDPRSGALTGEKQDQPPFWEVYTGQLGKSSA